MRQSSVTWHECRSIWGISFHDDLCSDFKVIQASEASLYLQLQMQSALVIIIILLYVVVVVVIATTLQ